MNDTSQREAAPNEQPGTAGDKALSVLPHMSAIIEIIVLIIVPALLDRYGPAGFPTLSDMQPHFFWLPVLLVSLQYGTVSGLLAAGTAIVATGLIGYPDQEIGENHFAFLLRISTQPALWLFAALILGQFRTRQIERKQELARRVDELNMQRVSLAQYCSNLRERCERLERQLASNDANDSRSVLGTIGNLLGDPSYQAPALAFSRCITAVFGPCAASLFVRDQEGFRLLLSHGWPTASAWQSSLSVRQPLADEMLRGGSGVVVTAPGDEVILDGQGVAAVPVYGSDGRSVVGILKIETSDAKHVDQSTLDQLRVLAVVGSALIANKGAISNAGTDGLNRQEGRPRPRVWRQLKWTRKEKIAGEAADARRVGR